MEKLSKKQLVKIVGGFDPINQLNFTSNTDPFKCILSFFKNC